MTCKHCGGRNGYVTDIRFKALRTYSWDRQDLDTDQYEVTSERNARCQDCGKPVRPPQERAAHDTTKGDPAP